MIIADGLGERPIQDVVKEHPKIGEILEEHEIGCVTCGVGVCLLKDVVSIHGLPPEAEQQIERQVSDYLETIANAEEN